MFILHPELKPYNRHQLKVSETHELYLDESGNPDGIPVLFVHGGPGGACNVSSRRFCTIRRLTELLLLINVVAVVRLLMVI